MEVCNCSNAVSMVSPRQYCRSDLVLLDMSQSVNSGPAWRCAFCDWVLILGSPCLATDICFGYCARHGLRYWSFSSLPLPLIYTTLHYVSVHTLRPRTYTTHSYIHTHTPTHARTVCQTLGYIADKTAPASRKRSELDPVRFAVLENSQVTL